ncbi:uncharacterized protein BDZ99DRAFT_557328 [Mytilinidion resinicola]|uniref:Uncharacterized protein n=1 Tax=Mytilinidion resinicola TaxID=574789 RepID=A0A6A6YYL1_9PEZI|nr:uncharacterized protein BDZ99DRAFT_557328 [Mytilinidion resinicola]KAF2813523.1 hypothetical protein BDZ99DRAFT_557328 [Mytilinidion resinicola]
MRRRTSIMPCCDSDIIAHSSSAIALSSSRVFHSLKRFRRRCLKISQTPSIGLRSGDCAGCLRSRIPCLSLSERATVTSDLVPCALSLSSWSMHLPWYWG